MRADDDEYERSGQRELMASEEEFDRKYIAIKQHLLMDEDFMERLLDEYIDQLGVEEIYNELFDD